MHLHIPMEEQEADSQVNLLGQVCEPDFVCWPLES